MGKIAEIIELEAISGRGVEARGGGILEMAGRGARGVVATGEGVATT